MVQLLSDIIQIYLFLSQIKNTLKTDLVYKTKFKFRGLTLIIKTIK